MSTWLVARCCWTGLLPEFVVRSHLGAPRFGLNSPLGFLSRFHTVPIMIVFLKLLLAIASGWILLDLL